MKSLIKKLEEVCTNHPFSEKILVVDHYRTGKQILHMFIHAGHSTINMKIMTVMDVAESIISHSEKLTKGRITSSIGSILMMEILKNLKNSHQLTYFNELEASPDLCHSIYDAIKMLRITGLTSTNFPVQSLRTLEKEKDIKLILFEYERMLEKYQLQDNFHILKKAIEVNEGEWIRERVFIFQPNLAFLALEEQLVSMLMQGKTYLLPIAPVIGVESTVRFPFIRDAVGEPTELSYLYADEPIIKATTSIELNACNTEENEVKEVLRRIKLSDSPFDTCSIFYSSKDPYQIILYQLAETLRLPVTFGQGIPIKMTKPGKLVSEIVTWYKNRYKVHSFLPLLQENILDLGENAPSYSSIIDMLINANIGWGKTRYAIQLQKKIDLLKERIVKERNQEVIQKSLDEYLWLQAWFNRLFQFLPKGEDLLRAMLEMVGYLLKHFAKIQTPYDELAKNKLLEKIDLVLPYTTTVELPRNDTLLYVENLLLNMNIGASSPKPGSIHITSYQNGLFINRPNQFFIGFDHQRFPGKLKEDTILLDDERENLHPNLPLLTEKAKENLYILLLTLACSSGKSTISYSTFDQRENRTNLPSFFFLKCYRYQTGDKEANFDMILKEYKHHSMPNHFINRLDWWQNILQHPIENVVLKTIIQEQYNHLIHAMLAKSKRASQLFTEYDGKLKIEEHMLDPRKNKMIPMSSGRFEKLATCPYKYFLEEVLTIQSLEPFQFDDKVWLDAKSRGIVLHEIFERFYKVISNTDEKLSFVQHEQVLLDILYKRIDKWKEQLLPPSKLVFEQEVNELIETCQIFLKSEAEHEEKGTPSYFEYSFGIGDEHPAVISLPDGDTFHLSGKIDRVDKYEDSTYTIIDYKTGKAGSYHVKNYYDGGRQLQHFLYAKALENKLNLSEGQVKNSTYLFPTTKGAGERRVRLQDVNTRENGIDIIIRLLDLLKFGHFPMTEDIKKDCLYCEYKHVCKRSSYPDEVFKMKGEDPDAIGVNRWKGVRAYE